MTKIPKNVSKRLKTIVCNADSFDVAMPWERGARRTEFVSRRAQNVPIKDLIFQAANLNREKMSKA